MERHLYSMHNIIRFITNQRIEENEWQDIEQFFHYVDQQWSRFSPSSEVSQLNRLLIGQTLTVSLPLARLLQRAIRYFEQTEHYFSPFLLDQQRANGYDRSFPFQKAIESETILPPDISPFLVEGCEVTRVGGGTIDLGGIGKGAAAMMVAQRLRKKQPRGLIEAGGDVIVWSDDEPWTIAITDPATETEIAEVRLRQGAVATSSRMYRSWTVGEKTNHHLLSGKTGRPIESRFVQITASAPQLYEAEVMTKLAFQMTEAERQDKLFKWFPTGRLLLMDETGKMVAEEKGGQAIWTG